MKNINSRLWYLFAPLVFFNLSCAGDGDTPLENLLPTISNIDEILVGESHTAEGFTVTLSDGSLAHFFRIESGREASHVGNGGMVAKITSDDNGTTWSEPIIVYDSEYDDRNVHGGMTNEGRIVLFFRKYDAQQAIGLQLLHIFSDDDGLTWSEPSEIIPSKEGIEETYVGGTNEILFIPGRGYMQSIQGTGYLELRFSEDGIDWSDVGKIWDYTDNGEYLIDEVAFTLVGSDTLVGIIRDQAISNYYQVYSLDKGETWTEPIDTNIASDFFTVSPLIFTTEHNHLVVIASERGNKQLGPLNTQSGLWIYINEIDELSFPIDFSFFQKIDRPIKTEYFFYGYPTLEKINRDEYLIVFSDAFLKINNKENCNLYSIRLNY